jgi:hypothetical protein
MPPEIANLGPRDTQEALTGNARVDDAGVVSEKAGSSPAIGIAVATPGTVR